MVTEKKDTTELFSDLFDHFADEDDDYEDMDDLDLMMNIKQEEEEEDFIDQEDDDVDLDETFILFDESKPYQTIEEQVLSQKLSQLSTSNKEVDGPPVKKIRKEHEEHWLEESTIPKYLSITSKSFQQMIEKQPWFLKENNNEEDLRQIAILMHKLAVNHLQNDLWMTYMKSGTGRLTKSSINEPFTHAGPPIWPVKVKSFILSQRVTTAMTIEEENKACLNFVHQFLADLNKKNEQYQCQLMEKKNAFLGYTEAMEKSLQTYIEQQRLYFLRLKCHLKQTLIDLDYQEQMLAMNYSQHHPNEYQKEVAQRLYSLKYELEKAKQQVALLKQRIVHNSPPKSFDSLDYLTRLASIDRIHDSTIRQRLSHRQDQLLQQTKSEMIAILITSAEATMRQWQKEFDLEMAKLWHDYRHSSSDQRLTKSMIDLIDERLTNITERFQAIYNFKNQYFFFPAPTVHSI